MSFYCNGEWKPNLSPMYAFEITKYVHVCLFIFENLILKSNSVVVYNVYKRPRTNINPINSFYW